MVVQLTEEAIVYQKGKDYAGPFDDERITDGVVSPAEIDALERKLLKI